MFLIYKNNLFWRYNKNNIENLTKNYKFDKNNEAHKPNKVLPTPNPWAEIPAFYEIFSHLSTFQKLKEIFKKENMKCMKKYPSPFSSRISNIRIKKSYR